MPATTFSPSLSRPGWVAELRALGAVIKRSWFIFRRYPSMLASMFIWPIIFPAIYIFSARALAGPNGAGLDTFIQATGSSNYIGYIAVGTTIWMWQNVALWTVGFALREEQMRGTLESNWLSPTWRFSFLLGSGLLQVINLGLFVMISGLEFWLVFGVRYHGHPLLVLSVFLAAMPAIYGIGFAFASVVITAKEANAFVFLIRGLVMIFCGITFPIEILPGWMQTVANWLPPTYIIRGIRNAALNNADWATLWPDLSALLAFGAGWLVIGYLLFNWMERRARQTGAIGQY